MNFATDQPGHAARPLLEAHDLVIQAWTRPEVSPSNGKYTHGPLREHLAHRCRSRIRPCGSPRRQRRDWDGRRSSTTSTATSRTSATSAARSPWTGFWRRSPGSAPMTIRSARVSPARVVSETDAQASASTSRTCTTFYQKCLNVWEGFAEAPGYRTVKTVQSGLARRSARRLRRARSRSTGPTWTGVRHRGQPADGAPAAHECIRTLRVGHLMGLLQIGSMRRS